MINGELACHTGIIQFPMRKGWKRVHRLVVLPDYQGIGIGTRFQDNVAQKYTDRGLNVNSTTTTPALVFSLRRNKKWILKRFGRVKNKYVSANRRHLNKELSSNRITYSFNYIGAKTERKRR